MARSGHFISDLQLSHFRSHRGLRLALDGRPVAIFGANGAGKTNILEAVSMLAPGRGLRGVVAEEMARRPEALGWKVRALIGDHDIETWAEPGASGRQVKIDGKAAPQTALGSLLRMVWLTPAMDRLWVEGAEGRRRFLDRLVLGFEPGHAEAALAYERAMRDRNRLLRDEVSDARWYAALESQMARAGERIACNRRAALSRLAEAQADAATAFPVADLTLSYPEAMPEDEPGLIAALAEGRRRDMAAGRSLTGPHRADLTATYAAKAQPAAQCSTGEQKALLISLVLANARALAADQGAAPVLLLDEVAAHLDASRRAALFAEVTALGAQAFLTGTGPELFTELAGGAQAFEVSEAEGISTVQERSIR